MNCPVKGIGLKWYVGHILMVVGHLRKKSLPENIFGPIMHVL